MSSDLEMAGDLRNAAAYLRGYGWRQGNFGGDGGPRCMAGAILSAKKIFCNKYDFNYSLALRFAPNGFDGPGEIGTWNDAQGRTLDEVLDRLESTATLLEIRALAANQAAEPLAETPSKDLVAIGV
jgi:hypothetical protein